MNHACMSEVQRGERREAVEMTCDWGGSAHPQRVQRGELRQEQVDLHCSDLEMRCTEPEESEALCGVLLCESSVIRICEECPAEIELAQTRLAQLWLPPLTRSIRRLIIAEVQQTECMSEQARGM